MEYSLCYFYNTWMFIKNIIHFLIEKDFIANIVTSYYSSLFW